jgi:type IV pilus assembly protein PilW
VEIMVGMVIGMLGIIVIMQVFALFEGQKRTTSGGGEAQNTGAIALSGLSDDLRQGGYGFILMNVIGCDVWLPPTPLVSPFRSAGYTITAMAPVTINSVSVPAGDANTDTLLIVYGNSDILPEGNEINQPQIDSTHFTVQAYKSFNVGDYVIAIPSGFSCVPPTSAILNQVAAATNRTLTITPGATAAAAGMFFNLGSTVTIHAYAVRNGSLTVCDYFVNDCGLAGNLNSSTVWVPIAGNIVSLRAQYGQDITGHVPPTITGLQTAGVFMDGIVDIYSQTPPADTGAIADACGWLRTLSIRLALVARNSQFEKTAVTAIPPLWEGSTAAGAPANPIDLTKNPNGTTPTNPTWQNYRYKVFQTTVPIRNITSSVPLGKASGC